MSFEEFQDVRLAGSHLGYWNETIIAILNLCHCYASRQVSAQSDLGFGRRRCLKNFKMATMEAILNIDRNRTILAILNLHVATMPPTKFQLNPTYGSGGDVENVKS